MVTKKQVEEIIRTIPDPEIGVSIVDLGLVYGIDVDKKGNVTVRVTLTSIGCPLFHLIETPIKEKISPLEGVRSVTVELTFEPPWSPDKMSDEARMQLGFV